MYPGRIDLGLGRASGTDPADDGSRCSATAPEPRPDDFPEQLAEAARLTSTARCRRTTRSLR